MKKINILLLIQIFMSLGPAWSKDYYFHPEKGNDSNIGTDPVRPFRSLSKITDLELKSGDKVLLAGGKIFQETLALINVRGTLAQPVIVGTYYDELNDSGQKARIDAQGLLNGVFVLNSSFLEIKNLEITGNGPKEGQNDGDMRVGVMIMANGNGRVDHVTLEGIDIFDVFFEKVGVSRSAQEVRSANGTQKYGWGIRLIADNSAEIENVWVKNSSVNNVSHTGIKLTGSHRQNIRNIWILNNSVTMTGGPGIQMSGVKFVNVKGNDVSYSGSNDDSRKWGRGSGLWTWTASHVMIEHNSFTYANGPGDSAGAHIDFNCDNVIVQYNFSAYNAGGFCEILGNNYNCAYRYNISVNDGYRVKGENGAFQEGKIFWLSGYQGEQKPKKGPVNSYFYNNTIYVKADQISKIAIESRSSGILIANNIFHLEGPSKLVLGDQYKPDDGSMQDFERVFFKNNLFLKKENWPSEILIQDSEPLIGSVDFSNPGGMSPEDYIPMNKTLQNKGISIPLLPNDHFGLMGGMDLPYDFLGNPNTGHPGIGAINYIQKQ